MPYQEIPIVDCHVNFVISQPLRDDRPQLIRTYRRQQGERFRKEWDFPPPSREIDSEAELAERWHRELLRYGIDRLVFVWKLIDNDRLAECLAPYGDTFYGFASHDPTTAGAAEELRRAIDDHGLIGYKLVAPRLPLTSWEDAVLEPIWRLCAERSLPVMIHFGPYGTGSDLLVFHPLITPLTLWPIASRYPEIPFIIPHFGCAYPGDLLQLMWACPNVHVDTSGSNQWLRWLPCELTLKDLFRRFYEAVGPTRILFGSDSRDFPRGFSLRILQDQLRACRELNLPESDLRAIFGGNAARLLGISLEAPTDRA